MKKKSFALFGPLTALLVFALAAANCASGPTSGGSDSVSGSSGAASGASEPASGSSGTASGGSGPSRPSAGTANEPVPAYKALESRFLLNYQMGSLGKTEQYAIALNYLKESFNERLKANPDDQVATNGLRGLSSYEAGNVGQGDFFIMQAAGAGLDMRIVQALADMQRRGALKKPR